VTATSRSSRRSQKAFSRPACGRKQARSAGAVVSVAANAGRVTGVSTGQSPSNLPGPLVQIKTGLRVVQFSLDTLQFGPQHLLPFGLAILVGGYPAARHAFQELFTARSLGINTLMVIAMGGAGSAQAMESADVVLMGDDLRQLSFIVRLSRSTWRTIRANIAFALAIKAAVFVLAVAGVATLWMAILADVGAVDGNPGRRGGLAGRHPQWHAAAPRRARTPPNGGVIKAPNTSGRRSPVAVQ